ncbi:hypothetical protein [Hymenobacter lucidus]|uniref:Uncharacterized protein n=1 Tax=Hymenobacter lucidus TaxID=2880930 RepID=A0ABS8AY13_9BACT|nr:hypothetical protein [Hymenobacter lucidus]MCB2410672.1 hypothetical protein [Hymenobacter lucidus]
MLSPVHVASAEYSQPVEWADATRHGRLLVAFPTRVAGTVWQPPQA